MAGISSEELSAAAGIVLSLGFSYIPGVSQHFDGLTPTQKRLVMLGLLLACALGAFGLSCLKNGFITALTCDRAGAWGLAKVFAAALIANQAVFAISPRGGPKTGESGPQTVQSTGQPPVQTITQRKMYIRRPVYHQGFQSVHAPAKNEPAGSYASDQRDAYDGTSSDQREATKHPTAANNAGATAIEAGATANEAGVTAIEAEATVKEAEEAKQ